MAIEFMQAVWELSPYRDEKLLVQLACADWANSKGEFWPSYDEIAAKARITQRGAIQIMAHFKAHKDFIQVHSNRGGRGKKNCYKFGPEYQEAVASIRELWRQKREKTLNVGSEFKTKTLNLRSEFRKPETLNETTETLNETTSVRNNRHENRHVIGTHTIFFPAADAEKTGVGVGEFKIPSLTEFTQEFLDGKLTAWLEKYCPSVLPQIATNEFLDHHHSEATQFKSETEFIRAWRGWMRNAQKIQSDRADRRARKGTSHASNQSDGFDDVDWEGLRLAGIIN